MKRTLEEHIKRIKELSLIKEDIEDTNVAGTGEEQQVEVQADKAIDSPEFQRELHRTLERMASSIGNYIRKVAGRVGDNDGDIESKEKPEAGPNELAGMDFMTATTPPKLKFLLNTAFRKRSFEFDDETLNRMSHTLVPLTRKYYREYYKIMYENSVKHIQHLSDEQKQEFIGKIIIASVLICVVWEVLNIDDSVENNGGDGIDNDMYTGLIKNLEKWIPSIFSFRVV